MQNSQHREPAADAEQPTAAPAADLATEVAVEAAKAALAADETALVAQAVSVEAATAEETAATQEAAVTAGRGSREATFDTMVVAEGQPVAVAEAADVPEGPPLQRNSQQQPHQ